MPKHLNSTEAERLSLLLEECGEALQVIGKIQRHGYDGYESCNQFDPLRTSNRSLLEKELGHIMHAIWRMSEAFDISEVEINKWKAVKAHAIRQYLHHQQEEATHA